MMTREDVIALINNTGLHTHLGNLGKAIVASATQMLLGNVQEEELSGTELTKKQDRQILDLVGPAAASSAVEYAINHCRKKGQHRSIAFNGSYIHNVRLIQNDSSSSDFSSTLRQYLLPRYAYLDFDQIVDPRHRIDAECGYPKFITPIMYRYMYDRDDVARRVNDIYPNESWSVDPDVYEDEDEETDTPFEKSWKELCDDHNLMSLLFRFDKCCGIGHYGSLLIGLEGEGDLEKPIDEPELLAGIKGSIGKKQRKITYLRPFDEYLSFIQEYEADPNHPRYGQPKVYNLVFVDMTIDAGGAAVGTRVNRRVHWSRIIHAADNMMTSMVFGIPRMQSVFNRLLDLRKLKGGGAEMFWKGAFPGLSFEVDPKFMADNPDFNKDELREDVDKYFSGLQRGLFLQGITAKTLAPSISDNPDKYVKIQMEAISSNLEMPLRVFMGSEEGRLSSSQDMQTWNRRLGRHCRLYTSPVIIRNSIDRFVAIGAMVPTQGGKRYFVEWPDLDAPTDEDKANLSLKWTQAMSQYVATGMIHLIEPMDFMTGILGIRPSQAKRYIANIEKSGGWAKLKAVDPAQGAGQNGVRENNQTKGQGEGTSSSRPKGRNTADKSAEGKTS